MHEVTLYQFELCPYCHKVAAGLELKGIPFRRVQVNPMHKKELPPLPPNVKKKVPVIEVNGQIIWDSTDILKWIDDATPHQVKFYPDDPVARKKAEEVEAWVDDVLTFALPTVIYGTWGEALTAAQVTAKTSNFGALQNLLVRAGGSIIMHEVSKRILKKRGRNDGREWLASEVDRFEAWLGEQPFVCGNEPTLADVAVHGALTCIKDFPAYRDLMQRPRLAAWYDRMARLREQYRARAAA